MPSILETAKAYIQAGIAPVPIDMRLKDGKPRKHPTRKWKPWQDGPMSPAEAARIWTPNAQVGVSIISGIYNPIHLCALDIEAGSAAEQARILFAGKTIMVESGRGGIHIWVRSTTRCIGGSLAPGIADLQATGQLIVVPPTSGYSFVSPVKLTEAYITAHTIEVDANPWALETLRKLGVEAVHLQKAGWESLQGPVIVAEARNQTLASLAGKLRERLRIHPSNIEAMLRGLYEHRMPHEGFDPDEEIPKMARQTLNWEIKYGTGEYDYLGEGQTEPPPATWLWHEIIYEHFLTLFYGLGGTGKTELLHWLCYNMLLGKPCLGLETQKVTNIIWWDYEVDLREFTRRAFRYARALGLKEPPPGIHYFRGRQPASGSKAQEDILDMIESTGAEFLVLDSVFRALGGDPLEQRDLITNLFVFLDGLPIPCGIIDHSAKPQFGQNVKGMTAYGFGGKMWTARNAWQIIREEVGSGPNSMAGLLRREKNNCGLPNNMEIPFQMQGLNTPEVRIVSLGTPVMGKGLREQIVSKIIEQARPMTAYELQSEHLTGHLQDSIRKACEEAAHEKLVLCYPGKGRRPSLYAPLGYKWPEGEAPPGALPSAPPKP